MPYLSWKSQTQIQTKLDVHPKLQSQLLLTLGKEELEALKAELELVFAAENTELKLEINASWTLYFKLRTGASRMQLAHPQKEEWVATLNLSQAHALKLCETLDALGAGQSIALSQIGQLAPLSNFELVLQRS